MLLHARALLSSSPEGATDYIDADLRDPASILEQAAAYARLGPGRSRSCSLLILHLIPDDADPYAIVAGAARRPAPRQLLVVSHPARDIQPERLGAESGAPVQPARRGAAN